MNAESFVDAYKKHVGAFQSTSTYWSKLQDPVSRMSPDQVQWTMKQPEVIEADAKLKEAFTAYMFERFKEDFASVPQLQSISDSYIDTVIATSSKYIERTQQLEQEVEELKKKLESYENGIRNQQ